MGLTAEQVKALLAPKPSLRERYPIQPQNGPLRFVDKELRCASRGCGSPTHMKVEGVPYCSMHTMHKLNEMIIEMTEIRRADLTHGFSRNGSSGSSGMVADRRGAR